MTNDYKINLLLETGGGGAARHVLDLYWGLKRRGRVVCLLLSLQRADPMFLAELAMIDPKDIHEVDIGRSPHPLDIVAAIGLRRFLRRQNTLQIVHAHSTKAGALAMMLKSDRTITLFTPHAYRGMDVNLGGWRRALIRLAEKYLSRAHQKVIAVSPTEYEYARELGVSREKLTLISNGINLHEVQDVTRRSAMNSPRNPRNIGFVGRLVPQKNPLIFLKALKSITDSGLPIRGHIVGDGPLRPMLEQYAEETGLLQRVTFHGTVPAIPLLATFDLLIHTSIYESLPYTLLEAVALGVPVVSVRNAGSEAIFRDRIDLIDGHADYTEIANAVIRLLCDPAALERIKAAYEPIRREISLDTMLDKVDAEYNTLWRSRAPHTEQVLVNP